MNAQRRASAIRLGMGLTLLVMGLAGAIFFLPNAQAQKARQERNAQNAQAALRRQGEELTELEHRWERIGRDQERLTSLLGSMPSTTLGQLQWELSRHLYTLAKQHGIRVQSVKYGAPSREGAKGTGLEAVDVETTLVGIYQNLKPFMLALEGSHLPFAVSSARLEESPDGGRLGLTLRAFRRAERPASREEEP